ncbi:recombinase family protein [Bradyrhizobium sp. Pear76]|uniref:recombinase family protein n=1 Tax=Bradyrhizobium oropedii TaxID=1571201 RepID=UPI001E5B85F2|nr:recombinase family protein [Bradyrhizobium oropedii]MCC8964904.1 recombinase family protein [Bradyrhizobium oropedii]
MANALVIRKEHLPTSDKALRAAQYVRMSTDMQQFSIQNQAAAIAAYAHVRGLKIVHTYRDEGESGLQIKNRAGLQQLINDITNGIADYGTLLVYDVSRWGRFQDTDESAHYEFICRQAGVKVAYCAEPFDNDGSMLSSIVKNLKRVMAAEYSRELSVKVHAGHCRIVRLGFSHGGPAAFAIQRVLVDGNQRIKGFLKKGQQKNLTTDHVRLRPGAPKQIAIVNWIFQQCLRGRRYSHIAGDLNEACASTACGRPWNARIVKRVLQNENYIGNIVYNRQSKKLKSPRVSNPPELWVRGEGCINPIVDAGIFQRAQALTIGRYVRVSEDEMLKRLLVLLHRKGRLSAAIINRASDVPHMSTYINHFGSLRKVYERIGYKAERDYSFADRRSEWARIRADLVREIALELESRGRRVAIAPMTDHLRIDGKIGIGFRVTRSEPYKGILTRYYISHLSEASDRWLVAIRLTDDNRSVLDYVLIPRNGLTNDARQCGPRFTDYARERLGFQVFKSPHALSRGIHRVLSIGRTRSAKQALAAPGAQIAKAR